MGNVLSSKGKEVVDEARRKMYDKSLDMFSVA